MIIINVILVLILIYVTVLVTHTLILSIGSILNKNKTKYNFSFIEKKVLILIPAYKEDSVILEAIKNIKNVKYSNYKIVVISQFMQKSTETELKNCCDVIRFNKYNASKLSAIQYSIKKYKKYNADFVVILDADNLVEPLLLKKLNHHFTQGESVVQVHRTAKNLDSHFSIFDAVAEEIHNNIYRKGAQYYNLSASLIGSGMAFEYNILLKHISNITVILGGEDKILDLSLTLSGNKIIYDDTALVYDEKVDCENVFKKQRTRWLNSQWSAFKYLKNTNILKRIYKLDYLNKFIQTIALPRILLLGALIIFSIITVLFNFIFFQIFAVLTIVNIISLLIAIHNKILFYKFTKILYKLPKVFFVMLLSIFSMKKFKNTFTHTPHRSKNNLDTLISDK